MIVPLEGHPHTLWLVIRVKGVGWGALPAFVWWTVQWRSLVILLSVLILQAGLLSPNSFTTILQSRPPIEWEIFYYNPPHALQQSTSLIFLWLRLHILKRKIRMVLRPIRKTWYMRKLERLINLLNFIGTSCSSLNLAFFGFAKHNQPGFPKNATACEKLSYTFCLYSLYCTVTGLIQKRSLLFPSVLLSNVLLKLRSWRHGLSQSQTQPSPVLENLKVVVNPYFFFFSS